MERAGVPPSPIRSDLRAFAVLRADPDPHLLGLPDLNIPLGPTAIVVHTLDASYRVNTHKSWLQPKLEINIF